MSKKASIHRKLVTRLAIAGIIISLVLGVIVLLVERTFLEFYGMSFMGLYKSEGK